MQSTAEARIMDLADKLDRIQAAFPEMQMTERKARMLLVALGEEDGDIIDIVVREALAY
jgi:hypothetical protein